MNINTVLGIISFLLWSAFSTWYYLNYISPVESAPVVMLMSNNVEKAVAEVEEEPEVLPEASKPEETVVKEVIPKTKKPHPIINISKNFTFHKNSDQIINEEEFNAFIENLKEKIGDRKVSIEIVGRTCDLGSVGHNAQLGLSRAESTAQALASAGVDLDIQTSSNGELDPIVPNNSEENRTQNRSVTITIHSLA